MRVRRDRNRADEAEAMLVKELHAAGMVLHRLVEADVPVGEWLAVEEIAQLLGADRLDIAGGPAVLLLVALGFRQSLGDDGSERSVRSVPDQDGADVVKIVGDRAERLWPARRFGRGVVDGFDSAQQTIVG